MAENIKNSIQDVHSKKQSKSLTEDWNINVTILYSWFFRFDLAHIYLVVTIYVPYTRCYGFKERGTS